MTSSKAGAAWLSVVSNVVLIVLKLVAGLLTGSIAILTEAIHSSIDLVASLIALFSVRKAEEPADEDHPYGHEKAENVAAGAEAMLILLGAVIIVIEAIRRLVNGSEVSDVGIGIAIIGISIVANLIVSGYLYRRARALESPALEGDAAHLRADALTSIAVLVGLVLVEVTGNAAFDSIAALLVAGAIVATGNPPGPQVGPRPDGRGAARRRARPDRAGDRHLPHARDGRLPQAPRPERGLAAPRRPARAVPGRDEPRGGSSAGSRAARRDRGGVHERRRADPRRARGVLPRRERGGRPVPPGMRPGRAAQVRFTAPARPTATTVIA